MNTVHNPNSWEARDLRASLHGFSNLDALQQSGPLVIERGEGVYVYDVHGRRYLEGNSGLWNVVAGFDNDAIARAGCDQLYRFPAYHTFFGRNCQPTIELAERLVDIAPVPISKVFFTNSGSEANDTAVKMLWMIHRGLGQPERRKIISRKNAYHGTTALTASLTGKDYVQAFGLPLSEVVYTDCPHHWRYAQSGESESAFVERLAGNLEQLIQREGAGTIAGFIAEPVMGAGGVLPPPQGYFEAIQNVLRKHDIPLIADEVICGLGRTGEMWGTQTFHIEPDVIVTSKCLTAGYFPAGAVLVSPDIYDKLMRASKEFEEFPHGFTTGGHPVGAAIGLKVLELLTEGGIFANVKEVAPHFQHRLNGFADHPFVGEARGVGLMGALEIVADKSTKTPFPASVAVGDLIADTALTHGLIIRPLGDSVVFAPPFIITTSQIDELFDALRSTLDQVQSELARATASAR